MSTDKPVLDDLMERMEDFRAYKSARVAGAPKFALQAFALQSNPASPLLANIVAKVSRWLAEDHISFSFGSGPKKSPARRQQVEEIDRDLLAHMVDAGFLERPPQNRDIDDPIGVVGSHAYPTGLGGVITMKTDHEGIDKVWESVDIRLGKQKTLKRWFILLHEAAHCELEIVPDPFRPSAPVLPAETLEKMNKWVFRAGSEVDFVGNKKMLEECFADAYGAMMLLEATSHDPDFIQMLAQVTADREATTLQTEKFYAQNPDQFDPSFFPFLGIHHTGGALRRVLDNREEWQGRSPQELKNLALNYASDAVLAWVDPTRPDINGHAQGDYRLRSLGLPHDMKSRPSIFKRFVYEQYAQPGDPSFDERYGEHPLTGYFKKVWPATMELMEQDKTWKRGPLHDAKPQEAVKIWAALEKNIKRATLELGASTTEEDLLTAMKDYHRDRDEVMRSLMTHLCPATLRPSFSAMRAARQQGQGQPCPETSDAPKAQSSRLGM